MDRFHWFCYCRTEGCSNANNANYIITEENIAPAPVCGDCSTPIAEIVSVSDPNQP